MVAANHNGFVINSPEGIPEFISSDNFQFKFETPGYMMVTKIEVESYTIDNLRRPIPSPEKPYYIETTEWITIERPVGASSLVLNFKPEDPELFEMENPSIVINFTPFPVQNPLNPQEQSEAAKDLVINGNIMSATKEEL